MKYKFKVDEFKVAHKNIEGNKNTAQLREYNITKKKSQHWKLNKIT